MSAPATQPSSHFTLQHEIFVLDAYLTKLLDVSKKESITRNLIDDLLETLRMEELGDLQIFDAADQRAPGWSFLVPITTSHISGHYFTKPGKHPHIRMDLYSCAAVNWRKAVNVINKHLELGTWRATFIERHIDESMRTTSQMSGEGSRVFDEFDLLDHNNRLVAPSYSEEKVLVAA